MLTATPDGIVPPPAMLETALAYLRRGWSILPMRMHEKRPAVRWKRFQTAPATEAQVQAWFSSRPCYGIGVVFGDVSGGLAERDFDEVESYQAWATDHPELAATLPTVETRRGCRVMFTAAPGSIRRLRLAIGKPGGTGAIAYSDGELRAGCGCYSVLPPSVHPSGHIYRWLVGLPDGPLPTIDPTGAGFVACHREHRENGEHGENPRHERVWGGSKNTNTHPTCLASSPPPPAPSCLGFSLCSLSQQQLDQAIGRTIPTAGGKRHRAVFDLCRELRALPELADVPADALRPIVQQWHRRALPYLKTRAFEETWLDFREAWEKVKYPKGQGPLDIAFQAAVSADVPDVARQYDQHPLRLLVALCRQLQRQRPGEAFFLSAREAGRLLNVDHSTTARWLRLLVYDRLLAVVETGSQKTGKASRYRYLADP